MRRPIPPTSTLAQSGRLVVWEAEHRAGIIDLRASEGDGRLHALDADDVSIAAVSPSGERVAIATSGSVAILRRDEGWSVEIEHELTEPFFRLVLDDSGLLVGVTANEDGDDSVLVLLDGDQRSELPLGSRTTFTLLLDAPRRRVLLAGNEGPGSFHGGGDPFVRLLAWDADSTEWSTLWEGPAPVESPNGWVMPLAFGDIGVYDATTLAVVSPDSNPGDVGVIVDERKLDHLETVVSSPNGDQIAWFWRDGDHGRIRSARLADGVVAEHPDIGGIDSFATLAVDDDGTVTMVDTVRPATIRIRTASDGDVVTTTHVVEPPG